MSIQYDSTELQNATYVPRYARHETAPERLVNSLKLVRQDGEVIIDDTMAVKYIDIIGVLIGTSQSDLETKIDAFKELIARKDKNLDITWAGGTRRYVCRSLKHEFSRDFYNILHIPYSIRFLVPTGYGTDTSETTALDKSSIVAENDSEAITFAGSCRPYPRHEITITTRGNADVVRLENVDTGDYMDIDLDGFSNGDKIVVDEWAKTVKKGGVTNLNYRGKFPGATSGVNNLKLTFYTSYDYLDQQQNGYDGGLNAVLANTGWSSVPYQAQSFIPTRSGRVYALELRVVKVTSGALTGPMQFFIFDDNNGMPGEPVASGIFAIPLASVPTSMGNAAVTLASGTRPFITAGQRYWIVFKPDNLSGCDANNFYGWAYSNIPTSYTSGKSMWNIVNSLNSATWKDGIARADLAQFGDIMQSDMTFKVYMGSDGNPPSWSVRWAIYYTKKYL